MKGKIYLDCDGTIMEHQWPKIGRYNPFAFEVIIALQQEGYEVIMNTMRGSLLRETLDVALKYVNEDFWMHYRGDKKLIPITHTPEKIHPHPWPFGEDGINGPFEEGNDLYIDDIATNMPLRKAVMTEGMMVNWVVVAEQLTRNGILKVNPLL
jgi:hypothetical protein